MQTGSVSGLRTTKASIHYPTSKQIQNITQKPQTQETQSSLNSFVGRASKPPSSLFSRE